MRCEEFEARLNDLLDLRLDPAYDPPLADHAANCRDCRSLLAAYDDCLGAVANRNIPAAPADLPHRVLQCSELPSPRVVSGFYRGPLPHLAAAAAIAFFAFYLAAPPERPDSQRMTRSPVPHIEAQPEQPAPTALALASDQAVDLLPNLSQGASGAFSDVASLWSPTSARGDTPSVPSLPTASPPVIAELASGLKPLADSATGSLYFLLDVLPGSGADDAAALDAPVGPAPAGAADEAI